MVRKRFEDASNEVVSFRLNSDELSMLDAIVDTRGFPSRASLVKNVVLGRIATAIEEAGGEQAFMTPFLEHEQMRITEETAEKLARLEARMAAIQQSDARAITE